METKCSIGEIVKDDCNLITYTRKIGLSLHDDEREIILWRCGLLEKRLMWKGERSVYIISLCMAKHLNDTFQKNVVPLTPIVGKIKDNEF